jgi:FAD/FMN-containing dehydrogenase
LETLILQEKAIDFKVLHISSEQQLTEKISSGVPALYLSSQTSTVLPLQKYSNLEQVISLVNLPKNVELDKETMTIEIQGPVTWGEIESQLSGEDFILPSAPTAKSACVLAGIATSCTGESSFHYGTLRDCIEWIEYFDCDGYKKKVSRESTEILESLESFLPYFETQKAYASFKNAPFPIFKNDCDLFIGTEGQLGIVTGACFHIKEKRDTEFVLVPTGDWTNDFASLVSQRNRLLEYRDKIYSLEFFDCNCLKLLAETPLSESDYIAVEINEEDIELVFDIHDPSLSILENRKWHSLREQIPTNINETLASRSLVKKGTDVQAGEENFEELLRIYQGFANQTQECFLFGHLGDRHLHFNFLPSQEEVEKVDHLLKSFYSDLAQRGGYSPFAEHGIGLLKQEFINEFWYDSQYKLFNELKNMFDPDRIFFPSGFMNLKEADHK